MMDCTHIHHHLELYIFFIPDYLVKTPETCVYITLMLAIHYAAKAKAQ